MYCRPVDVKVNHAARHAQRGQALAETVVCLPIFLLTLFGMLWAVKIAVQSERVQSAIRYAWSISQRTNPYGSFSFYSMYSQLGVINEPPVACTTPLVDPLSDAQTTYTSTASPPFFSPLATPTDGCLVIGYLFYYGATGTPGLAQDVLVSVQEPTITSTVAVPTALVSTVGSTSSTSATAFVYQQVGLNVLLACYPGLNTLVNRSLNILTDTSTAPTSPASLQPIDHATMVSQTEAQSDYFTPTVAHCAYTAPP
jgi:hypothetical protein